MNKAEKDISTLAWTRADFEAAGEELPEKLFEDDIHTEGELMTREDIDAWFDEIYKSFCIMNEHQKPLFEKLFEEFTIDVHYLLELGKIDQDEANEMLKKENYTL